MPTVADEVIAIFAEKGNSAYYGEAVSQLEHGLQAAYFARQERASDALVVAALVHDIGHLIADTPEDIADRGIDAKHEQVGQKWLASRFGQNVVEPVALHVTAKRYLCATDQAYLGNLSPASVKSLKLQGGPMSPAEVKEFEANKYHREAVALRKWDDQAKIVDYSVPELSEYYDLIDNVSTRK